MVVGKATDKVRKKMAEGKMKKVRKKSLKTLKSKPKTIKEGTREHAAHIKRLESSINTMNIDFVDYTAKHKKRTMEELNRDYHEKLFESCVVPLKHGISMKNVMACVGAHAFMAIVNKDFRDNFTKNFGSSMSDMVKSHVDAVMYKNAANMGLTQVWTGNSDRLLRRGEHKNKNKVPFTAESAAVIELGMQRQAYNDMRSPGVDVNKVMTDYMAARKALHKTAAKDGVNPDSIGSSVNTIAGQLIKNDPDNAKYFSETGYQGVKRGDFTTEEVTVQTPEGPSIVHKRVWNGKFENRDGSEFSGSLSPRPPASDEMYKHMMSRYLEAKQPLVDISEREEDDETIVVRYRMDRRDAGLQSFELMMKADGFSDKQIDDCSRAAVYAYFDKLHEESHRSEKYTCSYGDYEKEKDELDKFEREVEELGREVDGYMLDDMNYDYGDESDEYDYDVDEDFDQSDNSKSESKYNFNETVGNPKGEYDFRNPETNKEQPFEADSSDNFDMEYGEKPYR